MWAMMSTPLMLGMDLTAISAETLEIIKNHEIIAINQDAACSPPFAVNTDEGCEVWIKPLTDKNEKAVAFLNRTDAPLTVAVDWKTLGFADSLLVRDLWAHKNIDAANHQVHLPVHGIAVYRVRCSHMA